MYLPPDLRDATLKWTIIIALAAGVLSLAWDAAVWCWRLAFGG
jgi:hypothetical protein